jgi:hypothetical protein
MITFQVLACAYGKGDLIDHFFVISGAKNWMKSRKLIFDGHQASY